MDCELSPIDLDACLEDRSVESGRAVGHLWLGEGFCHSFHRDQGAEIGAVDGGQVALERRGLFCLDEEGAHGGNGLVASDLVGLIVTIII